MPETTNRPPAYRYHGKGSSKFRIPRPLLWFLLALAAVALILWGVAAHLQQYMVYSREGGMFVLPRQSEEVPDDPPPTDLVIVEDDTP